jgi:hypothetical protein
MRDSGREGWSLVGVPREPLCSRPVPRQRVLAPAFVVAIERVTKSPLAALEVFFRLSVFVLNFLLFHLLRRKGASELAAAVGVTAFGLARVLLTYRLEYPWDEVDLLLFATFGYAASRNRSLGSVALLLLVGTLNHETVLYIPLWYMIAATMEHPAAGAPVRRLRNFSFAAAVAAGVAGSILWMRRAIVVRAPRISGEMPETSGPISTNEFHLRHNLEQFLVHNWAGGRAFISIALSTAVFGLWVCRRRDEYRVAAWWSLSVIGAVFCFGYINETRLYLCLLVFWTTFAWPFIPRPPAAGEKPLLAG